jgi:hypothetical protein
MTYKVYIQTDEQSRITAVNSSAFLTDTTGWTLLDEGEDWPKYMHAQSNYFPAPLREEHGVPRYKLVDGLPVERTKTEIDADIAALPVPLPTPQEQTDALILDHEERLIYLELGVNE